MLADTYTLYLTTHNFHWNVTGPHFNSLHAMFMAQYTELWNSIDVDRRAHPRAGPLRAGLLRRVQQDRAPCPTCRQTPPKATEMVRILVKGHETVSRIAREFIPVAEEAGDDPTADMLTARCTVHDQTAWMLRSPARRVMRATRSAPRSRRSACRRRRTRAALCALPRPDPLEPAGRLAAAAVALAGGAVDRRRRLSRLAPAGRVRARHHPDAQRRLLRQRRGRPRLRPARQAHRAAAGHQRRGVGARGAGCSAPRWRWWPSRWC